MLSASYLSSPLNQVAASVNTQSQPPLPTNQPSSSPVGRLNVGDQLLSDCLHSRAAETGRDFVGTQEDLSPPSDLFVPRLGRKWYQQAKVHWFMR